jgi:hypothetical protein
MADFTFVPFGHFCDWNLSPFCLTPVFAGTIFNRTTIVNNYFLGPNGRIINAGIDASRVAAASRSEIAKVTVRDLTPAAGKVVKPDRLERDGSSLVVYRPQPLNNSPTKPGGQVTYNRQELMPQAGATPSGGHGASVITSRPVSSSPQYQTALASTSATSTRNLVPVVRLPDAAERVSPGMAATPQNRSALGTVARPVASRPALNSTMPGSRSQIGSANQSRSAAFSPAGSTTDQSFMPSLARYPTSPSISRPAASYSGSVDALLSRQEVVKPASSRTRYVPPEPWARPQAIAPVRPSFYNPPSITRQPTASEPYNYRSPSVGRAEPSVTPQNSARGNYYRSEVPAAGSTYYARPQAPSASYYRAPSYSSGPSYQRPTYSAPSYSSRQSYTPSYAPHYAAPAPSYHSSGGYSGGGGSVSRSSGGLGGRSSGGSSSSRSNH